MIKLMPSSHCTIFHSPTGFDKSEANRCSFTRETIVQCELSKTRSEVFADTSPSPVKYLPCYKYLELSAIHNPAENTSTMTYSQWESRIQGSGKFREDLFVFNFFLHKAINVQTTCIHFVIRIYRSGRLHEEGARDFPVNNNFLFFIDLRAFIGFKK